MPCLYTFQLITTLKKIHHHPQRPLQTTPEHKNDSLHQKYLREIITENLEYKNDAYANTSPKCKTQGIWCK